MTHDVFISHSNQDKHIALAICARLEADRIRCWIAPRDVPVGKSWPAAILDAIDQCRVMVLVLSSASNASKDVGREVQSAAQSGKMIVPFKIDDVIPRKELDYFLKDVHWLDAVTPPMAAHIEVLAAQLKAALEIAARRTAEEPALPTTPSLPSNKSGSATSNSKSTKFKRSLAIAATITALAIGWIYFFRYVDKPTADGKVAASDKVTDPSSRRFRDTMDDGTKGPEMLALTGGTHTFGSPPSSSLAQPNEKPQVTIQLKPFAVAVTEVTRDEFAAFVQDTGYVTHAERPGAKGCGVYIETGSGTEKKWAWVESPDHDWKRPGIQQEGDHPVVCVNHDDAMAYVNWMRKRSGKQYRLPSEFEAEYYMRSGRFDTEYPWGDTIDGGCGQINGQIGECHETDPPGNHSMSVYQLDPNTLGLKHALGNVHEWTSTTYTTALGDPKTATPGSYVIRGGSFFNLADTMRGAARWGWPQGAMHSFIGFRLARDLASDEIALARTQRSPDSRHTSGLSDSKPLEADSGSEGRRVEGRSGFDRAQEPLLALRPTSRRMRLMASC